MVERGRPLAEPTRAAAAVHPCGLTRDVQELDRVVVQNVTVNTTAHIELREAWHPRSVPPCTTISGSRG